MVVENSKNKWTNSSFESFESEIQSSDSDVEDVQYLMADGDMKKVLIMMRYLTLTQMNLHVMT